MRIAILLAAVSSIQICQQSVSARLASYYSGIPESIVSGSFPLGLFVATVWLTIFPADPALSLLLDSILLVVGAAIASIPWLIPLCMGRFIIGCGAGLGFVSSSVLLFQRVEFGKRPEHFFVLGIAFAFAALIANVPPLMLINDYTAHLLSCLFTAFCGVVYFAIGPRPLNDDAILEKEIIPSSFPRILAYALMVLNVTIGVPVILAFSCKIFEAFGASQRASLILAVVIPLLQMSVISGMFFTSRNRKVLIIGGYVVSIVIQGILLITSIYPYFVGEQKVFLLSAFLILLAVSSSVPCNTALCVITEQFSDAALQMRFVGSGRTLMWVLSTLSTATFLGMLNTIGFTLTFTPYFITSLVALIVVICTYPDDGFCSGYQC